MAFNTLWNLDFGWKRLVTALILIPLFVYLGFGLLAYFWLADKLIFQPQLPPIPKPYLYRNETLYLKTPSGEKISALFFKNEKADYTILFSHGNAEDIFSSDVFSEELKDKGFNVFAYDYRGYGMNNGKPSENNAYEDAETAYNYLIKDLKIAPEKIIIFGRSLGGGVAIDLASRKNCGGLIAESTFVSAFRVMTVYPIYPFDKFENLEKIPTVKCPVLLIHGKKDELIPFWHAEKLFAAANEPKYLYPVEEGTHGTVAAYGGENYFRAIINFADGLPK